MHFQRLSKLRHVLLQAHTRVCIRKRSQERPLSVPPYTPLAPCSCTAAPRAHIEPMSLVWKGAAVHAPWTVETSTCIDQHGRHGADPAAFTSGTEIHITPTEHITTHTWQNQHGGLLQREHNTSSKPTHSQHPLSPPLPSAAVIQACCGNTHQAAQDLGEQPQYALRHESSSNVTWPRQC